MTPAAPGPTAAVLDYDAGNLRSAEKSLQRAGFDAFVTRSADQASGADLVVVPGVGHFGQCVRQFDTAGFAPLIRQRVADRLPVMGICVGMQILYEGSDEDPDGAGFGFLPGWVRQIPRDLGLAVPHMGWNVLTPRGLSPSAPQGRANVLTPRGLSPSAPQGRANVTDLETADHDDTADPGPAAHADTKGREADPLLAGVEGQRVYFVHSYYADPTDHDHVVATTRYGIDIPAIAREGSVVGTQFHPEKSADVGRRLLENLRDEVSAARIGR